MSIPLQETEARLGNTELYRPLHSYFLLCPSTGLRNIMLVSDGHIDSEELTLRAAMENAEHTRLFTLGVRFGALIFISYTL